MFVAFADFYKISLGEKLGKIQVGIFVIVAVLSSVTKIVI